MDWLSDALIEILTTERVLTVVSYGLMLTYSFRHLKKEFLQMAEEQARIIEDLQQSKKDLSTWKEQVTNLNQQLQSIENAVKKIASVATEVKIGMPPPPPPLPILFQTPTAQPKTHTSILKKNNSPPKMSGSRVTFSIQEILEVKRKLQPACERKRKGITGSKGTRTSPRKKLFTSPRFYTLRSMGKNKSPLNPVAGDPA